MSIDQSKSRPATPVVVLHENQSDVRRYLMRLLPAAFVSLLIHGVLLLLFFLLSPSSPVEARVGTEDDVQTIRADLPDEPLVQFLTPDVDPSMRDPDIDQNYPVERYEKMSIPGDNDPRAQAGMLDSPKDVLPGSVAPPAGFHGGQGGGIDWKVGTGNIGTLRQPGGDGLRALPLHESLQGRSGSTREYALKTGGATTASEAAVAGGLKWLIRQQLPDGRWMLNGPTLAPRDRGTESNDIAATALGLLPLLATGNTHLPSVRNRYDKNIDKALKFLIRSQDPKTGYFGVSMYGHGLATITLCEAYGLTQDPALRRPAQAALNLIVNAQHEQGGWRYGPVRQPGDLSISAWQIMALKSGQMAGLDVSKTAIDKVKFFLDRCCGADEVYGYTGPGTSNRMTAAGLLCRQYMQNWGPAHPRMIKSISRTIKTSPPDRQDVYYYYYATQVMHHFGGEAWKEWNDKMREFLIDRQDRNESSPHFGSWSAEGDPYGRAGGRLMMTSLNLLTLEVYYRYLPLYYRDAGYQADVAVQKAL